MPKSAAAERDLLVDAVVKAGDIALAMFREGRSPEAAVWHKPADNSPVTEADLAVNASLRKRLIGERPDYGWLSEEDDDEEDNRLSSQRVFIVDPIDGTRAFTKGSRNFTISAALVESGALVAAAVFAPAHDELYAAALDQGTTMNGEIVQPSMRKQLDGASVLMREVDLNDRYWRGGAPALCRDTIGSIALRICRAAAGAVDGALSLRPAKEWDVAGGVLIAGEAGATVSNRRGKKLFFNQKKPEVDGLIAACAPLHRAILARLK
jgi:myo-inositol-1(or 4)-monophosphatase